MCAKINYSVTTLDIIADNFFNRTKQHDNFIENRI